MTHPLSLTETQTYSQVLGDFEAQGLEAGGWYAKIEEKGQNVLGSHRSVVPSAGMRRVEALVTRNAAKMWLSYAIVGPKDTLDQAMYTECTVTWKVKTKASSDS